MCRCCAAVLALQLRINYTNRICKQHPYYICSKYQKQLLDASSIESVRKCAEVAKHGTWRTANIRDIAPRIEFGSVRIH